MDVKNINYDNISKINILLKRGDRMKGLVLTRKIMVWLAFIVAVFQLYILITGGTNYHLTGLMLGLLGISLGLKAREERKIKELNQPLNNEQNKKNER